MLMLPRFGLGVAALAAVLVALLAFSGSTAGVQSPMATAQSAFDSAAAALPSESLIIVAEHDPFRLARRPAPIAYDPLGMTTGEPPPPPAPKPALVLTGLVWGSEPAALLEGLPGTEGSTVVRAGEIVNGFRIRRVTASQVVVAGADTVWALTVREPWR